VAAKAAGGEVEDDEDNGLDKDKLKALMEANLNRKASDEQEIEDLEGDIDIDLMVEDIALGKHVLVKVRSLTPAPYIWCCQFNEHFLQITKLAKQIFHNSILREDLATCCVDQRLK